MEGLTHICLSTLPCSFPLAQLHPMFESLAQEMESFCKGCVDQTTCNEEELAFIAAEKWPFLACVFWPTALESRLPWVAKLLCWFILLDTKADDMDALGADSKRSGALMQKYMDVIQGKYVKISAAAADDIGSHAGDCLLLSRFVPLWKHFRSNMTPTQYARLSERCSTLFALIAQQSKLREEGAVLSPAKLLELKRVVSSGMILVPLMEYAVGIELEEHILNRPEIQEIEVACVDHMVTANDVLSFRKEYLSRDFNNLPSAFCMANGVDFQTAVDLTSELVRDVDRRFCELHASICNSSHYFTPQVKAFVDGLGYMMSGTLEWSWHTARYHGLNWVVPPQNARQGVMYLEDPPRFEPRCAADSSSCVSNFSSSPQQYGNQLIV